MSDDQDTTERSEKNKVFQEMKKVAMQASGSPIATTSMGTKIPRKLQFEIPTELAPLPSKGLVYPEGSPLHNKTDLSIRAISANEEDITHSAALIKQGKMVDMLIQSCMLEKGIDPSDMIAGDRNAVLLVLRAHSYDEGVYKAEVSCTECKEKQETEFSILEFPIKTLGISPVAPGLNLFSFTLPKTKKEVHFKLLTGKDELNISKEAEMRKKQGLVVEKSVTTTLMHSIVSIDGVTDRTEISEFVRFMPGQDSKELRKYIEANTPGLDTKKKIECKHCSETFEAEMPVGADFFWPTL